MMDDGQFAGRVALVTGGGSGIGRATAIELGRQGASVTVLSRQQDRIDEACAAVINAGGQALGLSADVTSEAELADAVTRIEETWGRLDLVVANAGANGVFAPLDDLTLDEWNHTIATNLTSTFLTTRASLPLLKRQGGAIVVVSSVNGSRNFNYPGAVAYSTSKAGQVAFTKMVALELAQHGIRINVVCPGAIRTNIDEATHPRNIDRIRWPVAFPKGTSPLAGGPADPAQVGRVIAFLLSDAADHVSGTELWVDAAESLLVG
ncbi:MAG TPA: SDR family NAD(P)-dependent oxidoreductase [Thermomicrobiales bacterium]|nr:SDR family NAD(P)-dependent oxidoreductase [Thermomicrobiales bacterium]